MKKVITYGTYDMLHKGHIRLLERAKALGDYLIVGVTADDFDKNRGKINVKQTLIERIEAVKATGLADEIIVEEYEGQKIDDIRRYNIDIFTVGSDWTGKFDYLNEYCQVVYLERTAGISSTLLRTKERVIRLGLYCEYQNIEKYIVETSCVNGIELVGAYCQNGQTKEILKSNNISLFPSFEALLNEVDAVYISALPEKHVEIINEALDNSRHVLCETPISLNKEECRLLFEKAKENDLILMEANKTAYATAYSRLLLLAKSGKIGNVVSIDSVCTSLDDRLSNEQYIKYKQNSICAWGTVAMLPVFQLLGTDYEDIEIISLMSDLKENFDLFTKINFKYKTAVATIKVGKGVKSEGELIITGTRGYIYVPAPWWKTDYFEIRYENQTNNKRYFYSLEGEGIRYEFVTFVKSIESGKNQSYIDLEVSKATSKVIEYFYKKEHMKQIY